MPEGTFAQEPINDEAVITQWLSKRRGQKVNIRVPQKGQKERLVELAYENASLVLNKDSEKIKREEAKTVGAVKSIAKMLDIASIVRIEAFDISNISGFENVGSMIVYENGKPKRNAYRKFKLKVSPVRTITVQCGRYSQDVLPTALRNKKSLKKSRWIWRWAALAYFRI